MNIIIKNTDAIVGDPPAEFAKNVDIGIENGKISFIVPAGKIPPHFRADRIISGSGMIAMPGFANAHTHSAMTLMRNSADDLPLHKWLFERIFPVENRLSDEDVYRGTLLGAAEMIKSGTTAMADMYLHMEAVAEAVEDAGIRANLSRSPLKFHSSDGELKAEDEFEECRKYFRTWNGKANGRIKVYLEVHSTYLFDTDSLKRAALLAKELGTGIHIHLLETARERRESFEKYNRSPLDICAETGIFDVPVIGAHLVHLSEQDIELLVKYGVNAVHNPTSNLKLGSGISPLPAMLKAGANVSLGTDGAASNNNLNMFEEMHIAALIHKGVAQDPEAAPAVRIFEMATANGARAMGFGDETGVLKEGMKADIILVDTGKPHLCPMNDPFSAIVYSAQGSDVDTVIVDGNILMEKRELKTIDEEKVIYEASVASRRLLGR